MYYYYHYSFNFFLFLKLSKGSFCCFFFIFILLHATASPKQEDMSLHCTMCHRSCETGSSSSFALTACKKKKKKIPEKSRKTFVFYLRGGAKKKKYYCRRIALQVLFWEKGVRAGCRHSSSDACLDARHEELAASNGQPSAELVLKIAPALSNWVTWV